MDTYGTAFMLLMWKNWLLIRRSKLSTLFEILLPVIFILLLAFVRSKFKTQDEDEKLTVPINLESEEVIFTPSKSLAYSPCNSNIKNIIESTFNNSQCFNSEEEMIEENYKNQAFAAGIVFEDKYSRTEAIDSQLTIKLRFPSSNDVAQRINWFTDLIFPLLQQPGPRSDDEPDYLNRNFVSLQLQLTRSIIEQHFKIEKSKIPRTLVQKYPYPKYTEDLFYTSSIMYGAIYAIIFSFEWFYVCLVKLIVTDKECQLKESVKVMGVPEWVQWLAWFTRSFLLTLIIVFLMTILLATDLFTPKIVFKYSSTSLIFFFLLIVACSVISLAFLISTLFSNASSASSFCSIFRLLTLLPFLLQNRKVQSTQSKLAWSLFSTSGIAYGITTILNFEALEKGVHWSTLNSTPASDDNLTLGSVILMLLLDIIIYFLITLYIEKVFPGNFGIAQPWYFLCSKTYWTRTETKLNEISPSPQLNEEFEEMTESLPVGIKLENLSKSFGKTNVVKNINLEMYKGQITVLLGHNGAGKTTTISMIIGMFSATSGSVIVDNFNIKTNVKQARKSMGLCLQHNVLFAKLTVEEHIIFFSRLKGLNKDQIQSEVKTYLSILELENKKKSLSSTLSGGMKRKLCVAISLCGNSKVVILDEPTAGMDPSARRTVWELLRQEKKDRTILITTHFMDEADLLGDRIAIMCAGEIQCAGSSFFLKKKYGDGYYLIIDAQPTCKSSSVTRFLKKHISNIQVESFIGSELSYLLPEKKASRFEGALSDLENHFTQLKINGYGISPTTLERVFIKVGADQKEPLSESVNESQNNTPNKTNLIKSTWMLILNQMYATLYKKYIITYRNWFMPLVLIIVCVASIISTLSMNTNEISGKNFPPLTMELTTYSNPVTLLEGDASSDHYKAYKKILSKKSEVEEVDNIQEKFLTLTSESPGYVKTTYIVGASIPDKNNNIIAWYNGEPYHSVPLSLQLVLNAIIESTKTGAFIKIINHPLPLNMTIQAQESETNSTAIGILLALGIGFGLIFVGSYYIMFCITERSSKCKHLQFISGINMFTYWGTTYLYDFITLLLIILIILLSIVLFVRETELTDMEIVGGLCVYLIFFALNILPINYLLSFCFKKPSTGFSLLLIIGMILVVASLVLSLFQAAFLDYTFSLIAFYTTPKCIQKHTSLYKTKKICEDLIKVVNQCENSSLMLKDIDCCNIENYYSITTNGTGKELIFLICAAIGFLAIVFAIESKLINAIVLFRALPAKNQNVEEDVNEEIETIQRISTTNLQENYCLVLKNLTKYYGHNLAVNGLFLGVKPFECFGLLGVNGAGKTTTFEMITGNLRLSYGDAWINGFSITNNLRKAQQNMGYCPQFDALIDNLTARETLKIFALIRGVHYSNLSNLVEKLAKEFDFYKHLDKKTKQLSGGNKRKLSTAIALTGDSPVIYLDEPTTGMDPATKRFLWQALCNVRDSGKTIILTSHSMEECEALCTRLAIMVRGNFVCLGSTQRLKNKFAQGSSLIIKLKKQANRELLDQQVDKIDKFVKRKFSNAVLKEQQQELLSYNVPKSSMSWSKMFGILERNKQALHIEDYSIGQSSLEDVFLSLTK